MCVSSCPADYPCFILKSTDFYLTSCSQSEPLEGWTLATVKSLSKLLDTLSFCVTCALLIALIKVGSLFTDPSMDCRVFLWLCSSGAFSPIYLCNSCPLSFSFKLFSELILSSPLSLSITWLFLSSSESSSLRSFIIWVVLPILASSLFKPEISEWLYNGCSLDFKLARACSCPTAMTLIYLC